MTYGFMHVYDKCLSLNNDILNANLIKSSSMSYWTSFLYKEMFVHWNMSLDIKSSSQMATIYFHCVEKRKNIRNLLLCFTEEK